MNVISLDQITKELLLKRGLSLHWYLQFMVYAAAGLREIALDDNLHMVRYKVLPIDTENGNVVYIPSDFVDYAKVSVRVDQYLHPLVEDDKLDLVPNYDSNFDIQPYVNGIASQGDDSDPNYYPGGYLSPLWYMCNINSWGENLGRFFGGTGTRYDTFKVDYARNEIKINERLAATEVVLEYISNGMDADSATHINAYAQRTIEAYCEWQLKEHSRTYSAGEANLSYQRYISERQILRARLSDLTIDRLKSIVQSNNRRIKY